MTTLECMQGLITLEDLIDALRERRGGMWELRRCSICATPLHYMIIDEFTVLYDSNCNCTRQFVEPRRASINDLLDTFNMQQPDVRERMWAEFLLVQPDPKRAAQWQ